VVSLVQQLSDSFHWQLDVEKTAQELTASLEQNLGTTEEILHIGGLLSKSSAGRSRLRCLLYLSNY
jgi:hypothetical protein